MKTTQVVNELFVRLIEPLNLNMNKMYRIKSKYMNARIRDKSIYIQDHINRFNPATYFVSVLSQELDL